MMTEGKAGPFGFAFFIFRRHVVSNQLRDVSDETWEQIKNDHIGG